MSEENTPGLFDILGDINFGKQGFDDLKNYNAFIINRMLGLHSDTIQIAYDMTQMSSMDTDMQYTLLMLAVPKRRRFAKLPKKEEDADLKLIEDFYDVNPVRARELRRFLTKEHLEEMRKSPSTGGFVGKVTKGK